MIIPTHPSHSRSLRYPKLLTLLLLLICWLVGLTLHSYRNPPPVPEDEDPMAALLLPHTKLMQDEEFWTKSMQVTVGDDFDLSPIREKCEKVNWKEGVVVQCLLGEKGLRTKQDVLGCIRFGIEIGAGVLIDEVSFCTLEFGSWTGLIRVGCWHGRTV